MMVFLRNALFRRSGTRHRWGWSFPVVLVLLSVGCATTGEFRVEQARIDRLERKTADFNRDVSKKLEDHDQALASIRNDQADIRADLIDIRTEIQQLRGEVSSGLHQGQTSVQEREAMEGSLVVQLEHMQNQLEYANARVAKVENYFGLKPPKIEPKKVEPPSPGPPSDSGTVPPEQVKQAPTAGGGADNRADAALSSQEAYEMAYHLFRSGQMENARIAFERFVKSYAKSRFVDNALFWMGETYYKSKEYERAIVMYQKVLEEHPTGSKVPDAMLKMGYALEKLGEPKAAIGALERLIKEHPKSTQVELAKRKIEDLKKQDVRTGEAQGQ